MQAFSLSNVGWVGRGAAQKTVIRSKYPQRGAAQIPAIAGAVSVGVWIRVNGPIGNGYLIDLRGTGSNYWYAEGTDNPNRITIGGAVPTWDDFFLRTSTAFAGTAYKKLYMQFPSTAAGFRWLCRFNNSEFADSGSNPIDFYDLTVYGRAWTDAERLDASGPMPTDSMLARYGHAIANGQLLDGVGANHAALIGGPLEVFTS